MIIVPLYLDKTRLIPLRIECRLTMMINHKKLLMLMLQLNSRKELRKRIIQQ